MRREAIWRHLWHLDDFICRYISFYLLKGKELADITKLKRDIKIEEDIIKSYKMVIGEYVAANDLLREDELVFDQRSKILKSQEKLEELKEKLEEISKNK